MNSKQNHNQHNLLNSNQTNKHSCHSGHHNMMMMYMHGGFGNDYIIFKEWNPRNLLALIASCLALIFISILYEGVKFLKQIVENNNLIKKRGIADENESNELKSQKNDEFIHKSRTTEHYFKTIFCFDHIIQTVLYIFQFTISYFIMFSFMTYNYWYCLSILIGIGIGYFIFGLKRPKYQIYEDCH